MPCTSVALLAQYLNVCQRKLCNVIIQTVSVHILQHHSVGAGSRVTVQDGFLHGQLTLLPINPARKKYHYTSVPIEAAGFCFLSFSEVQDKEV
jgi:hypothetical protein